MIMDKQRAQIIKDLSEDLQVISQPGRTLGTILIWLLINTILAFGITIATGPFRPGVLDQIQTSPQFVVESLAGIFAIILLSVLAIRSGIPSRRSMSNAVLVGALGLVGWVGFYVYGFWEPAVSESMLGKREVHCNIATLLTGLPSLIIGLLMIRRFWPLHGALSGLLIGLAAGATPALIMQFACMYSIEHIFQHHLLPGLALGPIGMILGKYLLKK